MQDSYEPLDPKTGYTSDDGDDKGFLLDPCLSDQGLELRLRLSREHHARRMSRAWCPRFRGSGQTALP
jgi:hypothetical protein